MANETILRFNNVSFEYTASKKILDEVDFSVRKGAKITIMGQNGAGKSTIFQLMAGGLSPESGSVNVGQNITIALARQAVLADQMDLTLREFFQKSLNEAASAKASASQRKIYDIDPKIDAVLEALNLTADHEKKIKSFSGGQQARILLASALIQDSDLLLLDEPTNNLDKEGIAHLTKFLVQYKKTVVVISHDSDFLNAFTDGVLYLDVHTKKVQWYQGNYYDVLDQVAAQIEKEASQNARLSKSITDKKEKANYFANKGGRLRLLAARMREAAEEMEDNKVESRKDDKKIRQFSIAPGVVVGYYKQDFSTLNVDETVYRAFSKVAGGLDEQSLRAMAAGFLISNDVLFSKIGSLSEGQKGLVMLMKLTLLKPGLLILDEPTNHINFRHLPVIAKALSNYRGAMILVSHSQSFVKEVRIDETLELKA